MDFFFFLSVQTVPFIIHDVCFLSTMCHREIYGGDHDDDLIANNTNNKHETVSHVVLSCSIPNQTDRAPAQRPSAFWRDSGSGRSKAVGSTWMGAEAAAAGGQGGLRLGVMAKMASEYRRG